MAVALTQNGKPIKPKYDREYLAGSYDWMSYTGAVFQTLATTALDSLARYGIYLYDLMRLDPAVEADISILKGGILADGIELVSAMSEEDPATLKPEQLADYKLAEEILQFHRRGFDRLPSDGTIEDVAWQLLDCVAYRSMLAEIIAEPVDDGGVGKLSLARIAIKAPGTWNFVVDNKGKVIGYRGYAGGYGTNVIDSDAWPILPPDKVMVMSWMRRKGLPGGTSALDLAQAAWNEKISIPPQRWKYLCKFAVPSIFATTAEDAEDVPVYDESGVDTGATQSAQRALYNQLLKIENATAIVAGYGATATALNPSGSGEAFKSAMNECRQEIATAILGTYLAVLESDTSSKAQSEIGQDVTGIVVRMGKRWLAATIRGMLRNVTEWNWGKDIADRLTPRVQLGMIEHQDLSRIMNAVAKAWQAGMFPPAMQNQVLAFLGFRPPTTPQKPQEPKPTPGQAAPADSGQSDDENEDGDDTEEDDQ